MKFLKIGNNVININSITQIFISENSSDSKFEIVVFYSGYGTDNIEKSKQVGYYKNGMSYEEAKKELSLLYKKLNKGE